MSKTVRIIHFSILVQSSSKDADYLEHRINTFLDSYRKKEGGAFSEETVQTNKLGIINKLKQKDTSLGQEADKNWLQIKHNVLTFDRTEQKIAALEKVTTA